MEQIDRAGPRQGHFHAVRFYKDDASLCSIVSEFLGEGFAARQPALIVATSAHRSEILRELRARSFDVENLTNTGVLSLVDARELLSRFLVGGSIDSAACRAAISPLIEDVLSVHPDRSVRVYGEMVDLLWRDGLCQAAVRLEMLWNQLAASYSFSLLCSYSMGYYYKDASFDAICREHTHVVSEGGERAAIGVAQMSVANNGGPAPASDPRNPPA
jgi:MEDS: MEthanogen/methylotroph, DcmR Sensory domain